MLYWFKPNQHWNITTEVAYNYLCDFYGDDRLKTTEEEKEDDA